MKSLLLIFATLPLIAQEPPPAPEKKELELPAKTPSPRDDKLLELLRKNPTPEGQPAAGKLAKADPTLDAFGLTKRAPSGSPRTKDRTTLLPPTTANDLDLRIRYRKARTLAEQAPAAVAAWEEAHTAKTDYEKRESLKRYYEIIRVKVLAADPSVAPILNERHSHSVKALIQTRVDPTDPQGPDAGS